MCAGAKHAARGGCCGNSCVRAGSRRADYLRRASPRAKRARVYASDFILPAFFAMISFSTLGGTVS